MILVMASRRAKLSDQLRQAIKDSDLTRYRIFMETSIDQASLSRFVRGECGLALDSIDRLGVLLDLRLISGDGKLLKKAR